jgi:hypothetical protein
MKKLLENVKMGGGGAVCTVLGRLSPWWSFSS